MLIFVSDLHYRDDPRFTVPAEMTRGFLTKTLIPQIRDAGAREVTLVFLGDFVDINRALYWVAGDPDRGLPPPPAPYAPWAHWRETLNRIRPGSVRPDPGFEPATFEAHLVNVVDGIARGNADSFALWSALRDPGSALWRNTPDPPRVRLEFVPGNHDRLANYSAAVRRRFIEIARLDADPEVPFPWARSYAPDYPVVAFHGHVLSRENYGGGQAIPDDLAVAPWYDYPSIGDVVTVVLGVGLAHSFAAHAAVRDHARRAELEAAIAETDLLRPQSAAPDWLAAWKITQDPTIQAAADQALREAARRFKANDFVNHEIGWARRTLLKPLVGAVLDLLPARTVARLVLGAMGATKGTEEYTADMVKHLKHLAVLGYARRHRARYIVSGHTHRPVIIPLEGVPGGNSSTELVYFNSGTWLDSVEQGRFGRFQFTRRHQVTHVTFYAEGEERAARDGPDGRGQWEYWQGSKREG